MFGAKSFGENIFDEKMLGGFFIKSPVHNFGEKGLRDFHRNFETFHRNRHLVDRNICSHIISGNSMF